MSIDGSEISDGSNDTLVALKPMKNNFEFISFENGDIVELSAVENANKVWVRAVKHDDLYEKLLSEINVSISIFFFFFFFPSMRLKKTQLSWSNILVIIHGE